MSKNQTSRKRTRGTMEGEGTSQTDGAERFFTTGQFSDLTVACKGKEWRVHKFQVCGQSDYFYTQCTSQFKEAHENRITLDDDDEHVVGACLEFLYTCQYSYPDNLHSIYKDTCDQLHSEPLDEIKGSTTHVGRMLFDADVFIAADKFFIAKLKDVAAARFEERCITGWTSTEFPATICKVFDMPRGVHLELKTPIIAAVTANSEELLRHLVEPDLIAAMQSYGELSTAVAMQVAQKDPKVVEKVVEKVKHKERKVYVHDLSINKYRCPCGWIFGVAPELTVFCCPNCAWRAGGGWWAHHRVE